MAKVISMDGRTIKIDAEQQRGKEAFDKFKEFADQLNDEYGISTYSILSNGKGLSFYTSKISIREIASGIVQTLLEDERLEFVFEDFWYREKLKRKARHIYNNKE